MLKLHKVQIARKGKGVKGLQTIEAFGTPVIVNGKAIRFTYEFLKDCTRQEVTDAVETFFNHNQRMIMEAMLRGTLEITRYASVQEEIEVDEVSTFLFDNDLAETEEKAIEYAQVFHINQKKFKTAEIEPDTLEEFAAKLKKVADKKKAAGQWKVNLVANGEVISTTAVPVSSEVAPVLPVKEDTSITNDSLGNK